MRDRAHRTSEVVGVRDALFGKVAAAGHAATKEREGGSGIAVVAERKQANLGTVARRVTLLSSAGRTSSSPTPVSWRTKPARLLAVPDCVIGGFVLVVPGIGARGRTDAPGGSAAFVRQ